jgi:hypothetical protein
LDIFEAGQYTAQEHERKEGGRGKTVEEERREVTVY